MVTICRGCCCGTKRKHPDTDHDAQLDQLRDVVGADRVRVVTECLGACEQSNVMVIVPSPLGRIFGGRPTWIGQVLDQTTLTEVVEWISHGGPGTTIPPDGLRTRTFPRPAPRSRTDI